MTPDVAFRLANQQVLAGDLEQAVATLDGIDGGQADRVRALRLAACVARLRGDLPGAVDRGRRCVAIQPAAGAGVVRLQAMLELAGWLLELEEPAEAVDVLGLALRQIPDDDRAQRAAVQRRRAAALVARGDGYAAARALADAQALAGDGPLAIPIAVDTASLGYALGDDVGEQLEKDARSRIERSPDPGALTQLAFLDAARQLEARQAAGALEALRRARVLALEAVLPVEYLAAAVGIAQVADSIGDRATAYASLATGWATVGDLLGPDVAEASFAPQLRSLRARWGDDRFAAVRAAYEAERAARHTAIGG